jgi:hypothetical protein
MSRGILVDPRLSSSTADHETLKESVARGHFHAANGKDHGKGNQG